MIKTLTNLLKQDKEKFVVPKGVQDCIPITAIYDDGIFRVGKDKYSKSFKFTDINFAVASREDKEAMFLEYSELLNSLDSGATTKLTINNRRLNRLDFEKTILIPETGDELDVYREEYNKMLLDKATGANAIVQDKYVTISINKKSVEDARTYFARVGADLIAHFARLGSKCVELETDERLRIVHDFFRVGEETAYNFNIKETRKKGHDFKDYVCPDTMEFEKDYFKMGNRYGRVLFLREYASYIKDSMVAELTDLNRNLMMSIDIVPVPTDEAVREAESRLLGVETNITNWQRKQNQNNNFSATVPYDMEQQKKEMKEFLDDLTTRDQRMMFAVLTMVHTADSKEQLDNDTEALLTTARKHLCQFAVLKYQQMDGLNTAMPFGTRKIDAFRTLTTESLAVFIPFRVQDIYHENGIYYGQNVISKNMIIADRRQLLNGNSFILGVSGGGKSFAAKGEIENIILSSNADVIIIDPEREYSQLVKALGGEIINISATSPSHINAMDMNKEYGDGANPVILKSEFIMSLCEQLIGGTNLGAKQKSIIDRCTASVYRDYQQRGYTGTVPTLQDFRAELLKQDEPEAREIALAIELFTHGSLNTFAKPTNVDTDNRLICYDILDLGKQLMPIGMLVETEPEETTEPMNYSEEKTFIPEYQELYLQNNDMVGWIKVEDTKINYPVMQSKDNPNFYLKHGFDKAYTDYGCPYVQENCDMELPSDNIIIYGHHMNDGSMFAGLMKFKDKSFWEKHKTVSFDTLTDRQTYEVIAVFKTVVYTDSPDSFKYYQFVNAETADDFTAYVERCKELSLYDTGVTTEYGDKLLTLSTCEYSRTNGRLVVVAKLINE